MSNKEPWGEGTPWKNSTAFFNYLRGCLRKAWSRNPIKLEMLKNSRKQVPNPNPKGKKETVWGCQCAMCNGIFPMSDIEVDHIVEAGSLNRKEDIQGFVERLLFISSEDLRVVCKLCNSALAYASKQKITFQEALATKKAIKMEKDKTLLTYLETCGIIPGSNAKKRREQAKAEILKEIL